MHSSVISELAAVLECGIVSVNSSLPVVNAAILMRMEEGYTSQERMRQSDVSLIPHGIFKLTGLRYFPLENGSKSLLGDTPCL